MQKPVIRTLFLGCSLVLGMRAISHCQSASFNDPSPPAPSVAISAAKPSANPDLGRIGVGIKMSLLGGGIEVAARVTHHSNLRAGFNMITYSRTFNKDGIAYQGQLGFKTVEAHTTFFPLPDAFTSVREFSPISATRLPRASRSLPDKASHWEDNNTSATPRRWLRATEKLTLIASPRRLRRVGETWFPATVSTSAFPSRSERRSRERRKQL